MGHERKIGVAMDFSQGSKTALRWAIQAILQKDDTLYIIHVKPSEGEESRNLIWSKTGSPLIPLHELRDADSMHGYGVELDAEVLEMLDSVCEDQVVVGQVYWGDPRERLCEAAGGNNLKLDLLVMGSRGLSGLQRVLLGSVTSYVVEHATCPVTVVKGPSSC